MAKRLSTPRDSLFESLPINDNSRTSESGCVQVLTNRRPFWVGQHLGVVLLALADDMLQYLLLRIVGVIAEEIGHA